MKRWNRWVLPVLTAALLLALASCMLSGDGEVIKGGITLQVGLQSRAITVTEYQVNDLHIEVYDPSWNLIDDLWWNVNDDPLVHTVYTYEEGEHHVMVTHFGDFYGDQCEATEGVMVPIYAGVITRVSITPGMIGVIEIGDGGSSEPCEPPVFDPPNCPEVYGTWGGYVDFQTGGDPMLVWVELTFDSSGFAQCLTFANEGDPEWLDDMSMRGVYTGADGYMQGAWTQNWWWGEWHDTCPPMEWSADYHDIGEQWSVPVDYDLDGNPDTTWELTWLY